MTDLAYVGNLAYNESPAWRALREKAREKRGPGRADGCRSDYPSYFTQTEPKVLEGSKGTWYWLVAGKQFLCSFRPGDDADKERAWFALLDYVKRSFPEPNPDSRNVVGPCCVPESGDVPKPMPPEKNDG